VLDVCKSNCIYTDSGESCAVGRVVQRKTFMYTMRMDPEVKQAAEKAAVQDRRSLSSLIEVLLIRYCQERGLLTEGGRLPKRGRR
jgi:hypothetical protein